MLCRQFVFENELDTNILELLCNISLTNYLYVLYFILHKRRLEISTEMNEGWVNYVSSDIAAAAKVALRTLKHDSSSVADALLLSPTSGYERWGGECETEAMALLHIKQRL